MITVEPLLNDHPRGIGNWLFNRFGRLIEVNLTEICIRRGRNVILFEYKHDWWLATSVTIPQFFSTVEYEILGG